MKAAFQKISPYTLSQLFSGKPTCVKIVAIPMETYTYMELVGLFSLIPNDIIKSMCCKRYGNNEYINWKTKQSIAQSIVENQDMLIPKPVRKSISKSLRVSTWNTYLNPELYTDVCFCCSMTKINRDNFHVGHVQSVAEYGDTTLENLRPICNTCNTSMGSQNMFVFMDNCGYTTEVSFGNSFLNMFYTKKRSVPQWLEKYNYEKIYSGDKIKPEYQQWYNHMQMTADLIL